MVDVYLAIEDNNSSAGFGRDIDRMLHGPRSKREGLGMCRIEANSLIELWQSTNITSLEDVASRSILVGCKATKQSFLRQYLALATESL
jgi:hypothetical protein